MATQMPPELTPAQAAALVTSGQKVYIGCCTSYARAIADALAARSEELENVTIGCSNIIPPMTFLDCANPDAFHISTYFMGYEERRALKAGRADFTSSTWVRWTPGVTKRFCRISRFWMSLSPTKTASSA